MANGAISEDCRFLNVWTPKVSTNAKFPVYVFSMGVVLRRDRVR
jgi:carboxylesterase type B